MHERSLAHRLEPSAVTVRAQRKRSPVQRVSRRTGDRYGYTDGLRQRQLGKKRSERRVEHASLCTGCLTGRGCTGGIDDQHEFPSETIRIGSKPLCRLAEANPMDRLEALGQLPCDDERSVVAQRRSQRGDRGGNSMRSLVEHQCAPVARKTLECTAAQPRLRRQESTEHPLRRGNAGRREGGNNRARARYRNHGMPGRRNRVHDSSSWIAHGGCASVGNKSDASSRGDEADHLARPGTFVVLVERQHSGGDAMVSEKHAGDARVLCRYHIDAGENVERAQRYVAQIPDGGADDI